MIRPRDLLLPCPYQQLHPFLCRQLLPKLFFHERAVEYASLHASHSRQTSVPDALLATRDHSLWRSFLAASRISKICFGVQNQRSMVLLALCVDTGSQFLCKGQGGQNGPGEAIRPRLSRCWPQES
eukprot:g82694.t1